MTASAVDHAAQSHQGVVARLGGAKFGGAQHQFAQGVREGGVQVGVSHAVHSSPALEDGLRGTLGEMASEATAEVTR